MLLLLVVLSAFLPLVSASCSNSNYTQVNGGACFKVYTTASQSYSTALSQCQSDGGSLASIHNDNEDIAIAQMLPRSQVALLGLQCVSVTDCQWADGSSYDYSAFNGGSPVLTYGLCVTLSATDYKWYSSSCGATQNSFVCRMPAVTNVTSCADNYTSYNGGCVKLKTTVHNYKDAEEDCNIDGGHLVSIHDYLADAFYSQLALSGNTTGVLIGLKTTSGGLYKWSDGSQVDYANWAQFFPDDRFGSCVQLLLRSDLGNSSQWTNVPCDSQLTYLCYKDAGLTPTLAPFSCPAMQLYEDAGKIYSPGFPVSFPSFTTCEYLLAGQTGTRMQLHLPRFETDPLSTLALFEGITSSSPSYILSGNANNSNTYTFSSNIVKMVFQTSSNASGGGWEVEFTSLGMTVPTTYRPSTTTGYPYYSNTTASLATTTRTISSTCPGGHYYTNATIFNPGYPGPYSSINCNWYINNSLGGKITIIFGSVDTVKGKDILSVYDGGSTADPLLGSLSGQYAANYFSFRSTSNWMTVNFNAQSQNLQAGGWSFNIYLDA